MKIFFFFLVMVHFWCSPQIRGAPLGCILGARNVAGATSLPCNVSVHSLHCFTIITTQQGNVILGAYLTAGDTHKNEPREMGEEKRSHTTTTTTTNLLKSFIF